MKEAFERIKERLEEESQYSCFHCMDRALSIVSEVEAEYMKNPVYQYAMVYAKNLVGFGVDVRENLDLAVAQSMALNQAYIKGVEDERKQIYEAEYGNGWIPCSERLPELSEGTECFKQSKCCLVALKWWDGDITESIGWYNQSGVWNDDSKSCKVIAWMPLPSPFKPEKGE